MAKKPAKPTKTMTGAEALIKCLESQGVQYIFGLPGGAAIPLFDALYESKIKTILVRHEQGATHMADGYARASGEVGVALATSGPGATNAITGIADAFTARFGYLASASRWSRPANASGPRVFVGIDR